MILPAAASCLEQTYRNIEVLVVDDGSTDAGARSAGPVPGPTILRQAAAQDRRLRSPAARVPGQEAAQLPAALNTGSPARGYPAARGEFLTWTSDDNAYEPNAIERMVTYLREHPEVGLVYCDYTVSLPHP